MTPTQAEQLKNLIAAQLDARAVVAMARVSGLQTTEHAAKAEAAGEAVSAFIDVLVAESTAVATMTQAAADLAGFEGGAVPLSIEKTAITVGWGAGSASGDFAMGVDENGVLKGFGTASQVSPAMARPSKRTSSWRDE